jgi:hypothetical protein
MAYSQKFTPPQLGQSGITEFSELTFIFKTNLGNNQGTSRVL